MSRKLLEIFDELFRARRLGKCRPEAAVLFFNSFKSRTLKLLFEILLVVLFAAKLCRLALFLTGKLVRFNGLDVKLYCRVLMGRTLFSR